MRVELDLATVVADPETIGSFKLIEEDVRSAGRIRGTELRPGAGLAVRVEISGAS